MSSDKKEQVYEDASENKKENQYGYHHDKLLVPCRGFEHEYTILYDTNNVISTSFKIMTWNVWGMNKRNASGEKYLFLNELMFLRMEEVVKCIASDDPDIVVLLEMSHESISMLKGFMRKYKLHNTYKGYGNNFEVYPSDQMENIIGRDLDNYVLSKYVPDKISQYCLKGNLGYTTGVTCVFFRDVCVIGCYLQAGSKFSPGQESVWKHYARCRSEQIETINDIINHECNISNIILCGDFNMDLDGDVENWPEIESIVKLQAQDTWRMIYPNKLTDPGLTEDTQINHMRWNMKFMEKTFRYDGIFIKNLSDDYKIFFAKGQNEDDYLAAVQCIADGNYKTLGKSLNIIRNRYIWSFDPIEAQKTNGDIIKLIFRKFGVQGYEEIDSNGIEYIVSMSCVEWDSSIVAHFYADIRKAICENNMLYTYINKLIAMCVADPSIINTHLRSESRQYQISKKLTVMASKLVGTESHPMDDDMFDDFMRLLSNKSIVGETRSHTYHPSDHFGVMTTFSF